MPCLNIFLWTNYIETLALSLTPFAKVSFVLLHLRYLYLGKFALAIC